MITRREAELRISSGGALSRAELSEIVSSSEVMTAGDLSRFSNACPEWLTEQAARDAKLRDKEASYLAEEAPLRQALDAAGFPVKWVWDLVNAKQNYYVSAIPILADHLKVPYSEKIREGIARALTIRESRGIAGSVLLSVLNEEGLGDNLRWTLANALTLAADRSNLDDIKNLMNLERSPDVIKCLRKALKTANKA